MPEKSEPADGAPGAVPTVSAIMAVYNGARYLGAALESALAQTYGDFELIVVDDGSSDESAEVVRGYGDGRIRLLQQENRGAAGAVATGLAAARGGLVAFLDQDDLWARDKLEAHVEWMRQRPEVELTFSWFRCVGLAGESLGLRSARHRGAIDFGGLLRDYVIGATSNMVARRTAIERAGGVDTSIPRFYDLDLTLRIALLARNNIEAIPRELMSYRRHSGQITSGFATLQEEWERVVDKMRGLAQGEVEAVEDRAQSNFQRYLSRLAYEQDCYGEALAYLAKAFGCAPAGFLGDRRNWLTAAACLSGTVLPTGAHRRLERLAGFHRG